MAALFRRLDGKGPGNLCISALDADRVGVGAGGLPLFRLTDEGHESCGPVLVRVKDVENAE